MLNGDSGRDRPITLGGLGAVEWEVLAGGHDARAALMARRPGGARRSGRAAPPAGWRTAAAD